MSCIKLKIPSPNPLNSLHIEVQWHVFPICKLLLLALKVPVYDVFNCRSHLQSKVNCIITPFKHCSLPSKLCCSRLVHSCELLQGLRLFPLILFTRSQNLFPAKPDHVWASTDTKDSCCLLIRFHKSSQNSLNSRTVLGFKFVHSGPRNIQLSGGS